MTPVPFQGIFAQNAEQQIGQKIWVMSVEMHYALAAIYIALFFGFSYFILRKRDL